MSRIHQITSYISYWLNEESEHSLHSPFVYELYKKVLINQNKKPIYPQIEKIRKQFIKSDKVIEIADFGSGSLVSNKRFRKISDIASKGLSKRKYSELYERLISHLQANKVFELGTSLGINTLYLSRNSKTEVTTFEGSESLAAIASAVFEGNEKENIRVIEGNIDSKLPLFLEKKQTVDFVLFDANHQYKATIEYFKLLLRHKNDNTCFVFDDIHLNSEMEQAWSEIKSHYEVTVTIDLYQIGIVFFNPDIRKQDFILTF